MEILLEGDDLSNLNYVQAVHYLYEYVTEDQDTIMTIFTNLAKVAWVIVPLRERKKFMLLTRKEENTYSIEEIE
jgi:hypothetical protein